MIDLVSILFSTIMVFYVIWRAAKLDRLLPWFETEAMYNQTIAKAEEAKEAAARRLRGGHAGPARPTAARAAHLRR